MCASLFVFGFDMLGMLGGCMHPCVLGLGMLCMSGHGQIQSQGICVYSSKNMFSCVLLEGPMWLSYRFQMSLACVRSARSLNTLPGALCHVEWFAREGGQPTDRCADVRCGPTVWGHYGKTHAHTPAFTQWNAFICSFAIPQTRWRLPSTSGTLHE